MSKNLNESLQEEVNELRNQINELAKELISQHPEQLYIAGHTHDGGIILGCHYPPADQAWRLPKKETT